MTLLTVDSLEKTFDVHAMDDQRVVGLDDVAFTVAEGDFLAVVGESGSGKSSLLKCLYRTYEPDSGSITYHPTGDDLAACDDRTVIALRDDEIGYASQFLDEIPRVPAVDVVARPLREQGVTEEAAHEQARELLGALDLPEQLWDAYPATFSGGERQRVNLAQAIAPKPHLLLLDEPTSALDPETRSRAIDLLSTYLDSETTVVGVFHNRDVVEQVADRVLELDDAKRVRLVPVGEYVGEVVA